MLKLEDLEEGVLVNGLAAGGAVTVAAVTWHGPGDITVIYEDADGGLGRELLSRSDEERLERAAAVHTWTLDGDGRLFKLASEARRIRSAHLFDPYTAIDAADIDPLPHQIEAVYRRMLPLQPLRYLLADDPGAGKTIMSGLYIRELAVRGDAERVLVVAPGALVYQWQDELGERFHLEFDILTNEMVESSRSGNPFDDRRLLIARLDHLARREDLQEKLSASRRWDLVVVDEAHKMSARRFGSKVNKTKRYQLGERLRGLTRHLLLLTATPHSGKPDDYRLFLALLDEDRFGGRTPGGGPSDIDASDLMCRRLKEDLVTFEGAALFPDRRAESVRYDLSEPEQRLYDQVTEYVQLGMDRAKEIEQKDRRRGLVVGFALAALQRRLASSPHAVHQSLQRRRDRLHTRLAELEKVLAAGAEPEAAPSRQPAMPGLSADDLDFFDFDDYDDETLDRLERDAIDRATAAETAPELRKEIADLGRLVEAAAEVRAAGTDTKWTELSSIFQSEAMTAPGGARRKIIVFTEHRDTLDYLERRITRLLGRRERVVVIHGGVRREERRRRQDAFINDPRVQVMVATDAAGEGVNLQQANLMVNYDLPWNPNRIEQRFGRIHRIGQTEVCHLWNLVAYNTREGAVFDRLLEKIEEQRRALGGQVYDVLGDSLIDRNLRDLLIKAIRFGDDPEVKARRNRIIDHEIGKRIEELVGERALVIGGVEGAGMQAVRDDMERAQLRKLQPGFISRFFREALRELGGRIAEREQGRFEVTRVPPAVRDRAKKTGAGRDLPRQYVRVVFEKHLLRVDGKPHAQLLAPGHPLLEAVAASVLDRWGHVLQQGAVLVDPLAPDERLRSFVQLEHRVRDGTGRDVSRRHWTVETPRGGSPGEAGAARHLDLRPIEDGELELVRGWLEGWGGELADDARRYAITGLCRPHLEEVRRAAAARVERVRREVQEWLGKRIRFWDLQHRDLERRGGGGVRPQKGFTAGHARRRADELDGRLKQRSHQLDLEMRMSSQPPEVTGGAAVVPQKLLDRLRAAAPEEPGARSPDPAEVDRRAVAAVMAAERALGREPEEMPHNNEGYDIESRAPEEDGGGGLYFIEVKGRTEGAGAIRVSNSQILHARNSPDRFILAVVEVPEDPAARPTVRYARRPFEGVDISFRRYELMLPFSQLDLKPPS